MTTATVTYTPWGWTKGIEELGEGVWRVTTPSHGGLKVSRERWESLPIEVRDAMFNQTFAEKDCEEPIVKTLLDIGDDRDREMALTVAGYFDRYSPALPFIRRHPPGIHYHVLPYRGYDGSNPLERFDTRVEAVECGGTQSLCQQTGVKP